MSAKHISVLGSTQNMLLEEIKSIASSLSFFEYDAEKILDPFPTSPTIIICYQPDSKCNLSSHEITQAMRANYSDHPIFFIATDKKEFDKKKLIKNGFSQVFLLPWEKSDLMQSMREQIIFNQIPELRGFKAIQMVDIIPNEILDFALKVYLPHNNKLVQLSHPGDRIDEQKLVKLKDNHINTVFIQKDDLEKFQKYAKQVFNGQKSETEKQERLDACVRELISDIFIEDSKENTFSKSQALLMEVKELIKSLLEDSKKDIPRKVSTLIGQEETFYHHITNVATYAGVFAISLGLLNPDHIALAGLLHDLGKINLPQEFADTPESLLDPKSLEIYRQHPKYTIDLIKQKRMALPDLTIKAILQHHEALDGSGYPEGLQGNRISIEAKVLAIADEFDHLTSLAPGRKKLTPKEVFEKLIDDNTRELGKVTLDLDLLKRLKAVYSGEQK